ncbi:hypothetical protein B0H34DRAFT_698461 [Crassisporium funariophilum]|nr:hypothetical protein B0H34DRAFT_698461 [Crassisporium funariophilum]
MLICALYLPLNDTNAVLCLAFVVVEACSHCSLSCTCQLKYTLSDLCLVLAAEEARLCCVCFVFVAVKARPC